MVKLSKCRALDSNIIERRVQWCSDLCSTLYTFSHGHHIVPFRLHLTYTLFTSQLFSSLGTEES